MAFTDKNAVDVVNLLTCIRPLACEGFRNRLIEEAKRGERWRHCIALVSVRGVVFWR